MKKSIFNFNIMHNVIIASGVVVSVACICCELLYRCVLLLSFRQFLMCSDKQQR